MKNFTMVSPINQCLRIASNNDVGWADALQIVQYFLMRRIDEVSVEARGQETIDLLLGKKINLV